MSYALVAVIVLTALYVWWYHRQRRRSFADYERRRKLQEEPIATTTKQKVAELFGSLRFVMGVFASRYCGSIVIAVGAMKGNSDFILLNAAIEQLPTYIRINIEHSAMRNIDTMYPDMERIL